MVKVKTADTETCGYGLHHVGNSGQLAYGVYAKREEQIKKGNSTS